MIKIDMSDWPYEMRPWKQTMDHMLEDSFSISSRIIEAGTDKIVIIKLEEENAKDLFNNEVLTKVFSDYTIK